MNSSSAEPTSAVRDEVDADGASEAAPPPAPASHARASSLLTWLRAIDRDRLLQVVSLLALCVLVKTLCVTHIDIYWDAGAKWHFARQWAFDNDFSQAQWSHHMARFGVNGPAYLIQRVFGTGVNVYFVMPIGMFALQALFVYLLASRLAGTGAGVLGALFMTFFSGMNRNATQLLPDGMVGTAAVMAAYTFVRFHEAEGKARLRWLVATAFACLWCYALKESSVLLFPGFGIAVLLSRRSFKEAFILTGIIAGYALLETAAFRAFTPYAHRLAIVEEEHGFYPPITFWGLFGRFAKLDPPWQMLFWLWVATLLSDMGSPDKRRRLLVLLPVGYVFLLTFLVRKINPIQQWMSFKPRYMSPAGGFFVAAVAAFAADGLRRAWALVPWPKVRELTRPFAARPGVCTLAVCVVLGAYAYTEQRPLRRHPLALIQRDADILNDTFRRNLPIIDRDIKNHRGANTVYAVYLKPEYLARQTLAKPGWLPDIQEGVQLTKKGEKLAYILQDGGAYHRGDVQRYAEEGCAVEVSTKSRVIVRATENLPARCKAPGGGI